MTTHMTFFSCKTFLMVLNSRIFIFIFIFNSSITLEGIEFLIE